MTEFEYHKLVAEHRVVDGMIESIQNQPGISDLKVKKLKQQRLILKDQIASASVAR